MRRSDGSLGQRLAALRASLGAARGEALALAVLALGAAAGLGLLWWAQRPPPPGGDPGTAEIEDGTALVELPGEELVVHVTGLVELPGVHRLPSGARVADALDAAGGALPAAWLDGLNLARPLVDGEQLLVPAEPPAPPDPGAGAVPAPGADGTGAALAQAPPVAGGAGIGGGVDPDGVVSLNRASVAELETLPGIGPVMAQRIVEHREANGPFMSVGQLREVHGIGEKTVAALDDLVRP